MSVRERAVLVIVSCVVMTTALADADDRAEYSSGFVGREEGNLGFYIGDACVTGCSDHIQFSFCNVTSRRCECDRNHPIVIDWVACAKPQRLGEKCLYTESCMSYDVNSHCVQTGSGSNTCQCKPGYYSAASENTRWLVCLTVDGFLNADVPTLVGVCAAAAVAVGLLCFLCRVCKSNKRASKQECNSSMRERNSVRSFPADPADTELPVVYRSRCCSHCQCGEPIYCECYSCNGGSGIRAPPPSPIADTAI